jgi:putative transposase
MKQLYPDTWPQFFTATISNWAYLLEQDQFKDVIINSLQYLVTHQWIKLNAFVIMNNHLHFIWQAMPGYCLKNIQTSFKKYTSQQFVNLVENNSTQENYLAYTGDRMYHFWKRNSLGIELFSPKVFLQKLTYIHENPVRAGICKLPQEYKYSSAAFYETGVDRFKILEHYMG